MLTTAVLNEDVLFFRLFRGSGEAWSHVMITRPQPSLPAKSNIQRLVILQPEANTVIILRVFSLWSEHLYFTNLGMNLEVS
jgi:hypothetical protein